ncbi:MAG: hypothetical protein WC575_01995 [Patescibacteria group bacterium]
MPFTKDSLHRQALGLASGGLILYDPERIGFQLQINSSIDITDLCPKLPEKKKRGIKCVRLDYAKTFKGELYVLITKCRGETDHGKYVYYNLSDLKKPDSIFKQWAKDFGLTPKKLRDTIRQYAERIK